MGTLYLRSKHFFEMGCDYYRKVDKTKITKEDNDALFASVGYIFEQAIELLLKQICYDFKGDHEKTHKLEFLTGDIAMILAKYKLHLDLAFVASIKPAIENIESDIRLYNSLSYGAKYLPDLNIKSKDIGKLIDNYSCLVKVYETYMKSREKSFRIIHNSDNYNNGRKY